MSSLESIGTVEEQTVSAEQCNGMCEIKPFTDQSSYLNYYSLLKSCNRCYSISIVCVCVCDAVGPGSCAHSCIGNNTCACFTGYKLRPDGKNCEGRKDVLTYDDTLEIIYGYILGYVFVA